MYKKDGKKINMFRNLEAEIIRAGISKGAIAEELKICTKSLYNRLNGATDWTIPEMKKLQAMINVSLQTNYTLDYLFR